MDEKDYSVIVDPLFTPDSDQETSDDEDDLDANCVSDKTDVDIYNTQTVKHDYKYYAGVAKIALRYNNSPENAAKILTEIRRKDAEEKGSRYYEIVTADKVRRAMEYVKRGAVEELRGQKVFGEFSPILIPPLSSFLISCLMLPLSLPFSRSLPFIHYNFSRILLFSTCCRNLCRLQRGQEDCHPEQD